MSDAFPPPVPQAPQPPPATPPAYVAPAGAYTAGPYGYAYPQGGYAPPAPPVKRSGLLGAVALVLALAALIVPSIVGSIAGYEIGTQLGSVDPELLDRLSNSDDLRVLAPVREQVLWAEIAFWSGTAVGLWALIQGIIAIATRRGRGTAIAAVIVAVLAPGFFFAAVFTALMFGAATGAIATYGGI